MDSVPFGGTPPPGEGSSSFSHFFQPFSTRLFQKLALQPSRNTRDKTSLETKRALIFFFRLSLTARENQPALKPSTTSCWHSL